MQQSLIDDARVPFSGGRFQEAWSALRGEEMAALMSAFDFHDRKDRVVEKAVFVKCNLRLIPEQTVAAEPKEFLVEALPQLAQRFDGLEARQNLICQSQSLASAKKRI